jgi:hypothetical protein
VPRGRIGQRRQRRGTLQFTKKKGSREPLFNVPEIAFGKNV